MRRLGKMLLGVVGLAGLVSMLDGLIMARMGYVGMSLGPAVVGWLLAYGCYRGTAALDGARAAPGLDASAPGRRPQEPLRPVLRGGPPPAAFPWGTLAAAGAWYFFDALVMGQGIMSMMAGFLAVMYLPLAAVIAAVRGRLGEFRPWRPLIVAGMAAMSIATVMFNGAMAVRNADRLIAACERYKGVHGGYPARLQDLVPEFLPSVPRAKYTLDGGEFRYYGATIEYTAVPPFGRRMYSLEQKKWGFLD